MTYWRLSKELKSQRDFVRRLHRDLDRGVINAEKAVQEYVYLRRELIRFLYGAIDAAAVSQMISSASSPLDQWDVYEPHEESAQHEMASSVRKEMEVLLDLLDRLLAEARGYHGPLIFFARKVGLLGA